jgi:hypothetical protein
MQEGIAQNRRNCQKSDKIVPVWTGSKTFSIPAILGQSWGSSPNSHRLLLSERAPELVSVWVGITSVRSRYKNDNGPVLEASNSSYWPNKLNQGWSVATDFGDAVFLALCS